MPSENKVYEYKAGLHAFGVGLSARSAWNTHITEYLHFGRDRRLCGLNNYPGNHPKALQVKNLA